MEFLDKVFNEDCLEGIKKLPDNSVDCCITSPPYYGLRDYGCDGQIGLEETPEEYIGKLVNLFHEIRRVLKDDGTLWVNIGDSYNGSGGDHKPTHQNNSGFQGKISVKHGGRGNHLAELKPKDLIGIPWLLAFALRADGWYLRQDIIWHKPACMPESVTDRCTKSHEYIFLLSKSPRYYFDNVAIQEPSVCVQDNRLGQGRIDYDGKRKDGIDGGTKAQQSFVAITEMRNKRDVWSVNPQPDMIAHFATYPPKLIKPCVLAGCRPGGWC